MKGFLAYCKFLLEQRLVIIIELQQNTAKEVKSICITISSFSFILSIKQDCMGMATNSYFSIILSIKQDSIGMATNNQNSKCKVLHENGSIPLSIIACVHINLNICQSFVGTKFFLRLVGG